MIDALAFAVVAVALGVTGTDHGDDACSKLHGTPRPVVRWFFG
jgi:hypothetical protein